MDTQEPPSGWNAGGRLFDFFAGRSSGGGPGRTYFSRAWSSRRVTA